MLQVSTPSSTNRRLLPPQSQALQLRSSPHLHPLLHHQADAAAAGWRGDCHHGDLGGVQLGQKAYGLRGGEGGGDVGGEGLGFKGGRGAGEVNQKGKDVQKI